MSITMNSYIYILSAVVSPQALLEELKYASHLSIPTVVVSVKDGRCHNLARCVLEFAIGELIQDPTSNMQVWVRIPMVAPPESIDQVESKEQNSGDSVSKPNVTTWHWWNTFRTLCDNSKHIGLGIPMFCYTD